MRRLVPEAVGEVAPLASSHPRHLTEPGFVLYELPLLRMRALLARASDDKEGYRASADKYFALAQAPEFQGHLSVAHAMTSL